MQYLPPVLTENLILQAGVTGDENCVKRLQDYVKAAIAPFQYPRAICFVETLPKTQTGKIQRFRSRQQ